MTSLIGNAAVRKLKVNFIGPDVKRSIIYFKNAVQRMKEKQRLHYILLHLSMKSRSYFNIKIWCYHLQ